MEALHRYQRKTGKTPAAFLSRPEDPHPDVEFYLDAFFFLSRFRGANGFSMNPLSYSDISDYADRVGLSEPGEFFLFAEVMGELDREFLVFVANKKKT